MQVAGPLQLETGDFDNPIESRETIFSTKQKTQQIESPENKLILLDNNAMI